MGACNSLLSFSFSFIFNWLVVNNKP